MLALSIIRVDMGGYVGHTAMHPAMIDTATRALDRVRGDLLIDGQVAYCGDDLALVMIHGHRIEAATIHSFAWQVFQETTGVARELGLYGGLHAGLA